VARSPSVAVIVLNWNGAQDTVECLQGLTHVEYPALEVVLVDNGSRPPAADEMRSRFPGITCIQLPENLGYAGGNNVGIRYALERGHDYVFVLNNDTIVTPTSVREAVAVAESDPRIGVVGLKILARDDPARVWVAFGQVTYRQGLVRLIGYYKIDQGQFDAVRDVEWVPGTAMLFRRRALEMVGLFDEQFFAYHEDVDWCTRAWRHGFRVVFAPRAVIYHKGHSSSGGRGYVTPRQSLAGRNMVLFVRKHGSGLQKAKFAAFVLATLPLQFIRRWITGEHQGVVLKVQGMLDALRGAEVPYTKLGLR